MTVVAAVVLNSQLIAVYDDGTSWRFVEGTEPKWEKVVERIANFT